jgi:hypothetical protein
MFEQISKFIAPIKQYVLTPVLNYMTKDANPAAKAYAEQTINGALDNLPKVLKTLDKTYNDYQKGEVKIDLETGLKFAEKFVGDKNETKDIFLMPLQAYNAYKNYQYLNGVVDGNLKGEDAEDDFYILSSPKI